MAGEFYQPELWQLTPDAQNQYARSMDPTGEYGQSQPENENDDEQSREQREQREERERRQRETQQRNPAEPVNINQIQNDKLKDLAKHVNNLVTQYNARRPISDRELEFVQQDLFNLNPPDDANFDQRLEFNRERADINARLMELRQIDVKGKPEFITQAAEVLRAKDPRDAIERAINAIDSNDPNYAELVKTIVSVSQDPKFRSEIPPERVKELRSLAEYAMEYATERVIGSADDRPLDQYKPANLYQSNNLDQIVDIARRFDEALQQQPVEEGGKAFDFNKGIYVYLLKLGTARQASHEVFRLLREGNKDQFKQGVSQYLGSTQLDFIENQVVGVSKAQRVYEKYYADLLGSHKGWPSPKEYEEVDKKVAALIRNQKSKLYGYDRDGNLVELRDWQKKRAAAEGMRMSALSERRVVYTILGDVPFSPVAADWLRSVEGEYLARSLAPLKMLPERFMHWPGATNFLGKIKQNFRTEQGGPKYYGLATSENQIKFDPDNREAKEIKELGLYGQDSDALAMLDTGNYEIKSSGWRSDILFLRLNELRTETLNGQKVTIGDFLDYHIKAADAAGKKAHPHDSHKAEEVTKEIFERNVRDVIKNQRLSLAVLMRFAGVSGSKELKTTLWENAATYLPSRIAAMLPGHTLAVMLHQQGKLTEAQMNEILHLAESTGKQPVDIILEKENVYRIDKATLDQAKARWESISHRLFLAEEQRVENDYTALRTDVTNKLPSVQLREGLDDYLDNLPEGERLTAEEKEIVHQIQKIGRDRASLFAKMTFPFTAFLDDAPRTDWSQFTGPDLLRAFNDNDSIEQGTGAVTGLISAPVHRPEQVVKAFEKAYEGFASPLGPGDTSKKMAVFVEAYLELVKKNAPAKYFGAAMQAMRMARSEIEEENLSADLAFDEKGIASILRALAQAEVISDEPPHGGSASDTMYMRLRKELGADQLEILKMYVRILMMILGPVVAIQFLKAILPGDLAKALS